MSVTNKFTEVKDPVEISSITSKYPEDFTFNVDEWLSKSENFTIKVGDNLGFAEHKKEGLYWVHFCFHTARGRAAIELTKFMLNQLCLSRDVKICIGLIRQENKKAHWVVRQVGFEHLASGLDLGDGPREMFMWRNTKNGNA